MRTMLCLLLSSLALSALAQTVKDFAPTRWLVLGPFPNEVSAGNRIGLDRDFLAPLGGETQAKLATGTKVGDAATRTVNGTMVDLAAIYAGATDNKVAYAYGVIRSEKNQSLTALFGSDDAAKVWVNGKLVHRVLTAGRALTPEEDRFVIDVQKGDNPVLVKVENGSGGWGFALGVYDKAAMAAREWRRARENLADYEIVPEMHPGRRFLLVSEEFPRLRWKDAPLIQPIVSAEDMKVRWFDAEANEVSRAERPGLYLANVETAAADGQTIRRMLPFLRLDPSAVGFIFNENTGPLSLSLPESKPPSLPISDAQWKAARNDAAGLISGLAAEQLMQRPEAVSLMLTLSRRVEDAGVDPNLYIAECQVKIRRKLLSLPAPTFHSPSSSLHSAPVLRPGSEEEAKLKPGSTDRLRAILRDWSREEGKPFSVVLARNGIVFLHEGFGEMEGRPLDKDALFYPASIGKTLFGTVFAQFVDQGLVNPDDPIGKYLPDWPKSGPKAVTFRNCLTHTSGIAGHNTYGGFWNAYLDNAFAMRLNDLEPGVRYAYGGDGNNLAGKALELISGRSMARLLQECLFGPLDADIIEPDLGYAVAAKSMDIAKVGQMILNKGAYGNTRFFSEETYRKFLPTKLAPYMPKLQDKALEWGYAISYMPDPDGPREQGALGPNVVGHGSASSSILRIDPDTGIVVVMGRYGIGDAGKYNEYRERFMRALKEALR